MAQSKQPLTPDARQLTIPGEGGREGPEAPSPELSERLRPPRNSSGNASHASSLLDLRQKLNLVLEELERLHQTLGDAEGLTRVKRIRQQGFRGPR